MKNIDELKKVIHRIDKEHLSYSLAARISGYSPSHIRNTYLKWKLRGDAVFIHGNKGKKSPKRTPYQLKQKIIKLYQTECDGLTFSYFSTVLAEDYDIEVNKRTVHNILNEAGISSPECRSSAAKETIHRPRARRECEGELVQLDATPFDWFGDGRMIALHGAIDDATGDFKGLYLCENECLYGYCELIHQIFFKTGGGHPAAMYTDRAGIFCFPPREKDKLTIEEQLAGIHERHTQWQRIMDELNIKQILAWSPQAKGRIERAWRTVQHTLPWKLRQLGIKDIETANKYIINTYLPWYNKHYGKKAKSDIKCYHKTGKNPEYILCARHSRHTNKAGVFSFEGYKWILDAPRCSCLDFELCISERGIKGYLNGKFYPVKLLEDIQETVGDTTPQVLKNIIFKYMYKDGHNHKPHV